MGMDSVEIVMRTEDEFCITLTDDEAGVSALLMIFTILS